MGSICTQASSYCHGFLDQSQNNLFESRNELVGDNNIVVSNIKPFPHSNIQKSELEEFIVDLFPNHQETIKKNHKFSQFLQSLLDLKNDELKREQFLKSFDEMIKGLLHNRNIFETTDIQQWNEIQNILSSDDIDLLQKKYQGYGYQTSVQSIYQTGPIIVRQDYNRET